MGCNHLSISKSQRLRRWSLEMEVISFHTFIYWAYDFARGFGLQMISLERCAYEIISKIHI